jgi:hypothetical protein
MVQRLYLAGAAALLWPSAAWALTVHTGVLADPRDGSAGVEAADVVGRLLAGSGAYDVVDPDVLQGRIGESPEGLYARCGGNADCWRTAARAAGVEQLVLVERVDAKTLGIRVLDATTEADFRKASAPMGLGAGPDPEVLDRLFFRSGGIVLVGAPEGARVLLDGWYAVPAADRVELAPIAAGKHTLEISGEGFRTRFLTALVVPGQTAELDAELAPAVAAAPGRWSRWTTWVGAGVLAGAAVTLVVAADAPGLAVEP